MLKSSGGIQLSWKYWTKNLLEPGLVAAPRCQFGLMSLHPFVQISDYNRVETSETWWSQKLKRPRNNISYIPIAYQLFNNSFSRCTWCMRRVRMLKMRPFRIYHKYICHIMCLWAIFFAWWVPDLAARGLPRRTAEAAVEPSSDKNPKLGRRAPKYPRLTSTNCPNDSGFGFCPIVCGNYDWIMMIRFIPKVYDHVRFTNGPLRFDL